MVVVVYLKVVGRSAGKVERAGQIATNGPDTNAQPTDRQESNTQSIRVREAMMYWRPRTNYGERKQKLFIVGRGGRTRNRAGVNRHPIVGDLRSEWQPRLLARDSVPMALLLEKVLLTLLLFAAFPSSQIVP